MVSGASGPESVHLHEVWNPVTEKSLQHGGCHPQQWFVWLLNLLTAVLVAVCSQVVHYGLETLGDWRMSVIHMGSAVGTWAANVGLCGAYVLVACLCAEWQPSSMSSGIPGVIAYLNGVDLEEKLLGRKVLLAKLVGVTFACGSSLAVGPEGPMIHIGACAGVLCCKLLRKRLPRLAPQSSRALELHAAAVGAGCGVAAAFQAPIAGTLFVVEEAATYLSQRFFVHVFTSACLSLSIVVLIIQPAWQQLFSEPSWQFTPLFQVFVGPRCSVAAPTYYASCALIGIICGLLGSVFNQIVLEWNFQRQSWRSRNLHTRRMRIELVLLVLASCTVEVLIPVLWTCEESTLQHVYENSNQCIQRDWSDQMFRSREGASRMEPTPGLFGLQYNPVLCPEAIFVNRSLWPDAPECNLEKLGLLFPDSIPERQKYFYCCGFEDLDSFQRGQVFQFEEPKASLSLQEQYWPSFHCRNASVPYYNPMAALAYVPDRITVRNLFTRGAPRMLTNGAIFTYLCFYFLLAAATSGACVASGLVVPMMLIGGSVGRMAGNLLTEIFKDAYECPDSWIPEYQQLLQMLQARGVRSLPQTCGLPDPGSFAVVGAAAFMSGSGSIVLFVIALLVEITGDISSILPIAVAAVTGRFVARTFIGHGLYHDLMHVTHLPFLPEQCPLSPELRRDVVGRLPGGELRLRLLGLVESSETLRHVLEEQHQSFPVVSSEGLLRGLVRRELLEKHVRERGEEDLRLEEVADMAPYAVEKDFPVERAYVMFRHLGLRQLVVTSRGLPVGILTRRSFL